MMTYMIVIGIVILIITIYTLVNHNGTPIPLYAKCTSIKTVDDLNCYKLKIEFEGVIGNKLVVTKNKIYYTSADAKFLFSVGDNIEWYKVENSGIKVKEIKISNDNETNETVYLVTALQEHPSSYYQDSMIEFYTQKQFSIGDNVFLCNYTKLKKYWDEQKIKEVQEHID